MDCVISCCQRVGLQHVSRRWQGYSTRWGKDSAVVHEELEKWGQSPFIAYEFDYSARQPLQ
jgi:hypothetical protein